MTQEGLEIELHDVSELFAEALEGGFADHTEALGEPCLGDRSYMFGLGPARDLDAIDSWLQLDMYLDSFVFTRDRDNDHEARMTFVQIICGDDDGRMWRT
jgi:hypothetical protein